MVENSKIEWTTHTFNPWIGCAKVSAGCQHCYAETLMDTRYGKVEWGVNGTRVKTSKANWRKPILWNNAAMKEQFLAFSNGTTCERPRVFCASLADVFEDRDELAPWRRELLELIETTPYLDWLLLTKRPENARDGMVFSRWGHAGWPKNIWLGTSVEDQGRADERIPVLLDIPAQIRFLSMEPLLGPVDLRQEWVRGFDGTNYEGVFDDRSTLIECGIHWVIVGGESGSEKDIQPMHPLWVKHIRHQCREAGVPFFFKQWGEWAWVTLDDNSPDVPLNWAKHPEKYRCMKADGQLETGYDGETAEFCVRVGKKRAGRLLNGREYSEFPQRQKPGG